MLTRYVFADSYCLVDTASESEHYSFKVKERTDAVFCRF